MMLARPHTPLNSPCTLARSSKSKMSPMIVSTIGMTAPAPNPWIARKRISCTIVCEAPEAIEPSKKSAVPKRKSGLRP